MNGLIGGLALQLVDWPRDKELVTALDLIARANTLKPNLARICLNVKSFSISLADR